MYFLFKRLSFNIGLVLISLILLLGIFGPLFSMDPEDQVRNEEQRIAINQPPGEYGLLGTDQFLRLYLFF